MSGYKISFIPAAVHFDGSAHVQDSHGIIAAGPICKCSGMVPFRIVLRCITAPNAEGDEVPKDFVVHSQGLKDDGRHLHFAHGHYFPVHGKGGSAVMTAFQEAFKRWQEKVTEKAKDMAFDNLCPLATVTAGF